MIEQHVFVACLTIYMYLTWDNHWRSFYLKTPPMHVENVIMMFNHAVYVFQPPIIENRKRATQHMNNFVLNNL